MKIVRIKNTIDDFLRDYKNKIITFPYQKEYEFIHKAIFLKFYSENLYYKKHYSLKWNNFLEKEMGQWLSIPETIIDYSEINEKYNFL